MSARAGAESGKAAARRDSGEIPGRSALAGRGAYPGPAGTHTRITLYTVNTFPLLLNPIREPVFDHLCKQN